MRRARQWSIESNNRFTVPNRDGLILRNRGARDTAGGDVEEAVWERRPGLARHGTIVESAWAPNRETFAVGTDLSRCHYKGLSLLRGCPYKGLSRGRVCPYGGTVPSASCAA